MVKMPGYSDVAIGVYDSIIQNAQREFLVYFMIPLVMMFIGVILLAIFTEFNGD